MDSFTGRIIRNRYPSWTKIYKDDSAVASVLFNEIGNEIEKIKSSLYSNFKCFSDPLKSPSLTPNQIYSFDFKDYDYYKELSKIATNYKSIKFFKFINNLPIELNAFDINFFGKESFFNSYSEEFEINEELNFENTNLILTLDKQNSNDYFDIEIDKSLKFTNRIKFKKAKHVYIKISDCDFFYSKDNSIKNITLNTSFYVTIRGYDLLNLPVEETVFVYENQIYKSKNKFLSINDLGQSSLYKTIGGPCLTRHGFNGKVEILNYPINYDVIKINSKELAKDATARLDEFYEKQNSAMYISNDFNDRSEISYLLKLIEQPNIAYNRYKGDIFYTLFSQAILGLENDEYIQDIEYNYLTSKLLAISNKAKIYFLNLGMTEVKTPTLFQNSVEYDISFESMYQKYSLNDTASVIVRHGNASTLISKIILICEYPDKSIKYIAFNSDFNVILSTEPYVHSIESHPEVEKLWRQFSFNIDLEETGQYTFYSISLNPLNLEKELINLFRKLEKNEITFNFFYNSVQSYLRTSSNPKGLRINSYSLISESNTPVYSFNTEIDYSNDPLFGIYIDNIKNEIFIAKTKNEVIESMHVMKQKQNSVLVDIFNGQIYSFENYNKYKLEVEALNGDIFSYTRGANE